MRLACLFFYFSVCDKFVDNIVLLHEVSHIGLVIGPKCSWSNISSRETITQPIWKTFHNCTIIDYVLSYHNMKYYCLECKTMKKCKFLQNHSEMTLGTFWLYCFIVLYNLFLSLENVIFKKDMVQYQYLVILKWQEVPEVDIWSALWDAVCILIMQLEFNIKINKCND